MKLVRTIWTRSKDPVTTDRDPCIARCQGLEAPTESGNGRSAGYSRCHGHERPTPSAHPLSLHRPICLECWEVRTPSNDAPENLLVVLVAGCLSFRSNLQGAMKYNGPFEDYGR